jgi:hypothetical protein
MLAVKATIYVTVPFGRVCRPETTVYLTYEGAFTIGEKEDEQWHELD